MIPPVLPRRARATFTALENAFAAWASQAARDQRSPATRNADAAAWKRLDRTIYEALNTWGVPVEWNGWHAVFPGEFTSRGPRELVGQMFPGFEDKGRAMGDRIAAERKRKNGARMRATLARKKSRQSDR